MAIIITDNFGFRSNRFIDDRSGKASLEDLKNWDFTTNPLPDGFEVCVAGVWYVYNSSNETSETTGKFKERQTGSGPGDATFATDQKVSETSISSNESDITSTSTELFTGQAIYNYAASKLDPMLPFSVTASISPSIPSSVKLSGDTFTGPYVATCTAKKGNDTVTSSTTFTVSEGSGATVSGNQITISNVTGTNQTITYSFNGTYNGSTATASTSASFKFGYRFVFGSTTSTTWNVNNATLTESDNMQESFPYDHLYTTTDYPVFCVPKAWMSSPGNIGSSGALKVFDSNGLEYTDDWIYSGEYTRSLTDGSYSTNVTYYVFIYRKLSVLSNFLFKFNV